MQERYKALDYEGDSFRAMMNYENKDLTFKI